MARWIVLALFCVPLLADVPVVPLPMRGETLRVAVVGDVGKGSATVAREIARVHAEQPFDAILLTGDNFYPCSVQSVDDPRWSIVKPLTEIGPPVFPVLGNHDYCGNPDAQIGAALWTFPAREYVVRSAVAEFWMIDTTPVAKGTEGVGQTILSVLRAQGQTGLSVPHRFAVGHHPIVSSGWHGHFPRAEVRRMRALLPALREAKVTLYICGHDHHQELIRANPSFLISGAGSSPIPPIALHHRTVYPTEIRRERIGFAVLEVSRTAWNVRFVSSR